MFPCSWQNIFYTDNKNASEQNIKIKVGMTAEDKWNVREVCKASECFRPHKENPSEQSFLMLFGTILIVQ